MKPLRVSGGEPPAGSVQLREAAHLRDPDRAEDVGEPVVEPGRRHVVAPPAVVAERALPPAREAVRIVPTHFGDESGMLGAALLALDSAPPPA